MGPFQASPFTKMASWRRAIRVQSGPWGRGWVMRAPPHRHDFEEMFTVLDGELEVTFRGTTYVAGAGATVNVPANAPHQFRNVSAAAVRLLCVCVPAGQDEFFAQVGDRVPGRTAPPPPSTTRPGRPGERTRSLLPYRALAAGPGGKIKVRPGKEPGGGPPSREIAGTAGRTAGR